MKNIFHTSAIVLLIFNGISAFFGGLALLYDPSGNFMKIPLSLLQYSPFPDFLIPAIILLVMNGLSSFIISVITIIRWEKYYLFIIYQGCISLGWIVGEVIIIRSFHYLHLIYGLIGFFMITIGVLISKLDAK